MNKALLICKVGELLETLAGPCAKEYMSARDATEDARTHELELEKKMDATGPELSKIIRGIVRGKIKRHRPRASLNVCVDASALYDRSKPKQDRIPSVTIRIWCSGIEYSTQFCPLSLTGIEKVAGRLSAAVSAAEAHDDKS